MDIPGYSSIVRYATPPNSYIGTAIFVSYIVFALYGTISIITSLYQQYDRIFHTTTKDAQIQASRAARLRHIKIYAFLSSLSFATLSYHMLMFLITHYQSFYSSAHTNALPDSPALTLQKLKTWLLSSTLFQDFASALVSTPSNSLITQCAIQATWFWNLWIAQKARQRRTIPDTQMRKFILLSQILPISFTATLFIMQLHLDSPDIRVDSGPMQHSDTKTGEKQQEPENENGNGNGNGKLVHKDNPTYSTATTTSRTRNKPLATLQIPNILLNACLLALPALLSHPIFTFLLLFQRAILVLPYSGLVSLRDSEVAKCITISGGFVLANAVMMNKKGGLSVWSVLGALGGGGHAVKAVGWDGVVGGVLVGVLGWGGGV